MTIPTETERALALYKPPFTLQHGYIFDATQQMVADSAGENALLRIRGWGRIGYLPDPETLQDLVGTMIATALTEYWERAADGPVGWKLAMRVLQSDLYQLLDDEERAECDALCAANPTFPKKGT